MGAHKNEQSSNLYLKLKAKTSDTDPTPFFGKQEKQGNEYVITEKFNKVDGKIISLETDTYEYQGETKSKFKIILQDADGSKTYIEGNFNSLAYSIFNSLAGTHNLNFIAIEVWLDKEVKNGKQYAQCKVLNDGERTNWKYNWNDVPKPEKVKVGNKTVTDDTKVVEFWTKEAGGVAAKLKIESSTANSNPMKPNPKANAVTDDELAAGGYWTQRRFRFAF